MKPIEQDQNYNGDIRLHTNSKKKDFQQQCVANEKMMVKMKKCFNDDDNGYDDNGADVKVKRAFKKPDCAGTQGAAAPSPSALLSRIQPLQLPLLQPLLQLHTTTTTITTTTTSIITRKTTSTTTNNSLTYDYNH